MSQRTCARMRGTALLRHVVLFPQGGRKCLEKAPFATGLNTKFVFLCGSKTFFFFFFKLGYSEKRKTNTGAKASKPPPSENRRGNGKKEPLCL